MVRVQVGSCLNSHGQKEKDNTDCLGTMTLWFGSMLVSRMRQVAKQLVMQ